MTHHRLIRWVVGIAAVAATAGCSLQYNGAWGSLDEDDQKTVDAAKEYHQQKRSAVTAQNPRGAGRGMATPNRGMESMGPNETWVSADGSQQGDAGNANRNPAFASPNDDENTAAAGPTTSDVALSIYGQLPDANNAAQSPLDSPQGVEQATFTTEGSDFDPETDPAGRYLVFASTRHREQPDIYLQMIGGTTVTQLTNDPAKDIMPTWSPDGSRIAFASDRSGNWDVYVMDVNGGKAQQITNNPTHDLHPSFSPDGTKLVYCSYGSKSGQWELVVIDLNNTANRQIIAHGLFPQWSPNGDKILFQRARQRGTKWFSVWTVDYEKGEAKRATEIVAANNAAAITPSWGPNGDYIVFSTVVSPDLANDATPVQANVWIVATDGSFRTNLTNNKFANLQPTWSRDGTIYFVSNRSKDGIENVWSIRPDQVLRLADPPAGTVKGSEKGVPSAAVIPKE